MGEWTSHTCYKCHKKFKNEDMEYHASPRSKTYKWCCKQCLIEVKEIENFSEGICKIFGVKKPGKDIWEQRKDIKNKYNYTDQDIIDCLDYLYNVKCYKNYKATLGLICKNPRIIHEMRQYKESKEAEERWLANVMANEINKTQHIETQKVRIKENTKKIIEKLNPDDWLDD